MNSDLYVQHGSGFTAPEGWLNYDSSLALLWERIPVVSLLYTKNAKRFPAETRYGDIVKGLPVASGSCRGVYASHVLEHLCLTEFDNALRHTFRMLAPGGVFRAIVPDLESAARSYLAALDLGETSASQRFMDETSLGSRTRPRSTLLRLLEGLRTSRHY
jgi:hypothetical protein